MSDLTIIDDEVHTVVGSTEGGRVLVDADGLRTAFGWELKAGGLCRGDVCVPVADPDALVVGGRLDVARVAAALGRPVVIDAAAGIVAMGRAGVERRRALDGLEAPDFQLRDLEGTSHGLGEFHGKKKLLVTFASWCGCRYDLPGWQELHDELADEDFTVIAVAIDHSPEDVRPWVEGISYPVLVDENHLLTELYAISNVPTVVWIDEDDRIVRPNGVAFGSDLFKEFTGVESGPHLDAVRRWVNDGQEPLSGEDARRAVADLTEDEVLARLHFRVAAQALRQDDEETARRHFATATELAPYDFTIRRAAMPLLGDDPFGATFFAFYEQWQEAGSPYHGLSATAGLSAGS
ncbi:MAG TPA: TlpA disulfide reductase family protein [Acidimicrobiales bacterium]|nr:TlpA disulfide reductase family protein [Acidimicrobiales bacterium]